MNNRNLLKNGASITVIDAPTMLHYTSKRLFCQELCRKKGKIGE